MTSFLDFQAKCKIKLFLKPALAVMEETPEGGLPALPGLGPLRVSSERYQIRMGRGGGGRENDTMIGI